MAETVGATEFLLRGIRARDFLHPDFLDLLTHEFGEVRVPHLCFDVTQADEAKNTGFFTLGHRSKADEDSREVILSGNDVEAVRRALEIVNKQAEGTS